MSDEEHQNHSDFIVEDPLVLHSSPRKATSPRRMNRSSPRRNRRSKAENTMSVCRPIVQANDESEVEKSEKR